MSYEKDLITEPEVKRIELGRKQADDEILARLVIVFGDDAQGYQASYEEWFIRAGGSKLEFFEVLFDTTTYPTADEALADALPSAQKETAAWLGVVATARLQPAEFEITNGYIGSWGITWKTATAESLADAVAKAAERNNKSEGEIVELLLAGENIGWCDSPNHYYDHSTGIIRRKRTVAPVALVKCDCGHSVPRAQVMSASLGSSCFDCYDRMSI
jgi:hypothetical protein